jgi:quinol monooxygenase YgiN
MGAITIIARARVQPGREEDMQQALETNAAASRNEDGCVSYTVLRGENGLFMTIERWTSVPAADAHMKSANVQALFATIPPWLAEAPVIERLREV